MPSMKEPCSRSTSSRLSISTARCSCSGASEGASFSGGATVDPWELSSRGAASRSCKSHSYHRGCSRTQGSREPGSSLRNSGSSSSRRLWCLHGLGHVAMVLAVALLLVTSVQPAMGDVAVLSDQVLTQLPIWAKNRSADIVMDFSKADQNFHYPNLGTISFRGRDLKVKYHIGYYHGNVAVVRFGTKMIAAVRKMHFYKTLRTDIEGYPISTKPNEGEISWWASKLGVCSVDSATLQPVACQDYDPRTWKECLWNKGFEGTGPEDPRLIVWPGKGLFMMFGSKPGPVNPQGIHPADTRCDGPWAFQQYLVLLQPYEDEPDREDPWTKGIIRLKYLDTPPSDPEALVKEKNWNPFIFKGKLYFSQQFDPHVVIEPLPNGTCVKAFETNSRVFKNLTTKPRGNTQAVLVPAGFSGEPRDFYLSVVHAEINRSYQNFFYKMQAHPPFRIFSVSKAMPIINAQHPRNLAWTSVSFPMSLDLIPETNQVMIGYGSGDKTSRVKMMPWQEVQALFPANQHEGGGTWRYRDRRRVLKRRS